jgi:hypothetical protein
MTIIRVAVTRVRALESGRIANASDDSAMTIQRPPITNAARRACRASSRIAMGWMGGAAIGHDVLHVVS